MTSFIYDTQENEGVKKLLSAHDRKQELEILHVQEELISLMNNLFMLLTLHELLYERTKKRNLPDFAISEVSQPSQQKNPEKSEHPHVNFAPKAENSFLKEGPL